MRGPVNVKPTKRTVYNIKGASPTSFRTSVPSSGRTKCQFQKSFATGF